MTRFASVVFLFVLCFGLTTKAQQHRYGSWNTVGVQYKLNKKWSLQGTETARAYPAQPFETQWLTDIGLSRELGKRFEITPSYRLNYRHTNVAHRVYCDLAYQVRPKEFQVTNRLRYQYQWDRYDETSQYLRNKVTIKYRKPKKITPLIAGELFYRLGFDNYFIDQYRVFVGADYKVSNSVSLSMQLMREQEIQLNDPMTTDVLQLEFGYEF